jgi:hypothetical protein
VNSSGKPLWAGQPFALFVHFEGALFHRYVADYGAVRDIGRSDTDAGFTNPADAALIQIPGTGTWSPREAAGECLQLVRGATTIKSAYLGPDRSSCLRYR